MRRYIASAVSVLLACASVAHAKGDEWKTALNDSLYPGSQIKITKTSLSMNTIKQPGTVWIMRMDGLSATIAGGGFAANIFRDGAISQKGSLLNAALGGANRREFKAGDKFYLIGFNIKDKQISFDLVSYGTYDVTTKGDTKSERYAAQLQFEFPDGYLASAAPAKVQETLDAVIINEERMPVAAPATVSLGQSFDEVEKALGKPEKIVNLGPKVTWVYKEMKVIFVDGKVSDVQ